MIRILLAAAILVAGVPPAHAQSVSQAAANTIRFDEIVANAHFSPQERSAITERYENVARSASDDLSKDAKEVVRILALYDKASPQQHAEFVAKVRRGIEIQPCTPAQGTLCAIEMPIIRAHDPVILIDRARKLVFTQASIVALVVGARSVAGRLKVAPPGHDAANLIAGELRARDARGETQAFDLMEDAASYDFNLSQWNHDASQPAIDKIHSIVAQQSGEANRVFFLSQAAVFAGKRAGEVGSSSGGGPAGMMAGAMRSQAMGMMSRTLSSRCMGVGTGGNYGYCSGL